MVGKVFLFYLKSGVQKNNASKKNYYYLEQVVVIFCLLICFNNLFGALYGSLRVAGLLLWSIYVHIVQLTKLVMT